MEESINDVNYLKICSEKTLQTNSKGFFMNFVEIVSESAGEAWIKNVFGKLKTDKERLKAIYSFERTKKPVVSILSNVQEIYREKNSQISISKRLEAEQAFQKGETKKSLALYSQSVIRAPETGNDPERTLSLALWGRSKVLISLNQIPLALTDIQNAIKFGLDQSLKADAYWKMGICYKALKEQNKANVSFGIAEKLLATSGELERLNQDRNAEIVYKTDKVHKVHPDIFTSRKIEIKSEPQKGRYAVANENIQTGETLVVEEPYAACLLPEKFGTHCHHCFQRLVAPVGCSECSNVAFCNMLCRDTALTSYHKFECKYIDLLVGSGMSILSHIALRMITQNNLKEILEIYKFKIKKKVYGLCTNSEKRNAEDFFQRTLMAIFLLRCLQKSGYFGGSTGINALPTEEEYNVGELILFHLQILQFNAHEIYETRLIQNIIRRSTTVYIGVAIYPTVALFNHDCYPAVTRHFDGKNIVIKACRPLQANDVIAENYGPIFTRRSLKERQISLSSRYWFNCLCNACIFNWPTYDNGLENVSNRIKCTNPSCNYYYTLPVKKDPVNCPKCEKDIFLAPQVELLQWCEEQYDLAFKEFEQKHPQKVVDILCKAIDLFHRISCPPHKKTQLAQEMLQICTSHSGNVFEVYA